MTRVFITSRGQLDYSQAEEYGELIAVTSGRLNIAEPDLVAEKVQDVLKDAAADDILLINGHPIIVVMAAGYLFRRHGYVNVLYHDPARGKYVLRKKLDFASADRQAKTGCIVCPICNRKIASAPAGVEAVAGSPCDECMLYGEDIDV
jgi:hypothetical protein